MSHTYKQDVKELSRELIWERAIVSLTEKRSESAILNPRYISKLWQATYEMRLKDLGLASGFDVSYLDNWLSFADQFYSNKKVRDLKVAYLSGPEPGNDLKILLNLGIRIENVWAFEGENNVYKDAIKSLKGSYPTLKVIRGKIDQFIESTNTKFDIIYLDFTGPIFSNQSKSFTAVQAIFDNQALEDLGVLIVNSCFPDKDADSIDFLKEYFCSSEGLEGTILEGEDAIDEDENCINISEGFSVSGICEPDEVEKIISDNFNFSYSAFSTHYPIYYASIISPAFRVLKSPILRRRIVNENSKKSIKEIASRYFKMGDSQFEGASFFNFINTIKCLSSLHPLFSAWDTNYQTRSNKSSKYEAVCFSELSRNSKELNEYLSSVLMDELDKVYNSLPDKRGGLFCDVPMKHLWLELAINQLGYVYHCNLRTHFRAKYKAKERQMNFDVFTFDKCRALYDWLPTIEYYGDDLKVIERQMLTRVCIDAIGKARGEMYLNNSYYGGTIVGSSQTTQYGFAKIPRTYNLNSEDLSKMRLAIKYL